MPRHARRRQPADADVRLDRYAGDVRRENQIGHVPEQSGAFRAERFLLEHVERRAAEPSGAQSVDERLLLD